MEGLLKNTYGTNNVTSSTLPTTSMPNVKLANKELKIPNSNITIPFDQRGFPIFDKYVVFETKLEGNLTNISSGSHMRQATKNLKSSIEKKQVSMNFGKEQLEAIDKNLAQIPYYTWHHHQDVGKMQLIPTSVHDAVKHIGGS